MATTSIPQIEDIPITRLRPYPRNARSHSKKQVRQIANSIEQFGFTNPVLISDDDVIIAGHGRVEAAKLLGMQTVPALRLSHLDEVQRRAYVLTDNKIALNSGWDQEVLAIELQALIELDFDLELTGFSLPEINVCFDPARARRRKKRVRVSNPADPTAVITRPGDIWLLGRHQLRCGASEDESIINQLLGQDADRNRPRR
jgi:ParB-like chromosome segregation protein Spo0J